MSQHTLIILLRGINVGGRRPIKMAALRDMLQTSGFQNVKTYIQSGNVVCTHPSDDLEAHQAHITAAIAETFGFDVPVMVFTHAQWQEIIQNQRFETEEIKPLHVTLLEKPLADSVLPKLEEKAKEDAFNVDGKAVYLRVAKSYYDSKLSNTFFEKVSGGRATTRNWKTTLKLAEMARELQLVMNKKKNE